MLGTTSARGRGWIRLHEKGDKEHEAPCVPKLEAYLYAYIAAAGIADDQDGPVFRTTGRGIKTRIGNHSMRATDDLDATFRRQQGWQPSSRRMIRSRGTPSVQNQRRILNGNYPVGFFTRILTGVPYEFFIRIVAIVLIHRFRLLLLLAAPLQP